MLFHYNTTLLVPQIKYFILSVPPSPSLPPPSPPVSPHSEQWWFLLPPPSQSRPSSPVIGSPCQPSLSVLVSSLQLVPPHTQSEHSSPDPEGGEGRRGGGERRRGEEEREEGRGGGREEKEQKCKTILNISNLNFFTATLQCGASAERHYSDPTTK